MTLQERTFYGKEKETRAGIPAKSPEKSADRPPSSAEALGRLIDERLLFSSVR